MTKEEETLIQIKFVIDMYSAGVDTADNALEKVSDLINAYKYGEDEGRYECGCCTFCGCDCWIYDEEEETPTENETNYCPKCGKKLEVAE